MATSAFHGLTPRWRKPLLGFWARGQCLNVLEIVGASMGFRHAGEFKQLKMLHEVAATATDCHESRGQARRPLATGRIISNILRNRRNQQTHQIFCLALLPLQLLGPRENPKEDVQNLG
jgi:hypothetical protein